MMFAVPDFRLEIVPECGSTNEELLQQRGRADFPGLALLALQQKAGRGRRGRDWQSLPGNLALSVAFRANGPGPSPALFPFLAGLAIVKALPLVPGILLKWPNDVYLNGRKLGGILSQAKQGGESTDLVVGVGLNLAQAPKNLEPPAISLAEVTNPPTPEAFARDFLSALDRMMRELHQFEDLKLRWEKAALLSEIELMLVGEEGVWRAIELLPSGELAVESRGEKRVLSSETVSVRLRGP